MEKKLFWVFLFVFIDVLGFSLILPLFPYYAQEFRCTPSTIGLILTSNALAQMVSAPAIGHLSDIYGRKPLLLLCIFGTFLSFLWLSLASSVTELFLSRILDGILGGNISLAQAYIADVTDQKDRSKGFGIIGAAFGLAFIFGPAFGGILSGYGHRLPAYAAATVSFINLIGVLLGLPESKPPTQNPTNGATPALSFGLEAIFPFTSESFYASIQKVPMLQYLLILRFCYGYTFTLFETCFGFFNLEQFGMTARQSSYLLAYVGFVFSMVQGSGIKSLTKRTTEGKIIAWACIVLCGSLLFWATSSGFTMLVVSLFPLSLSSGLLNTLINSEITRHVQQSELGGMLGLSASIGSFTRVVAPVSSGFLIDQFGVSAPGLFGMLLMGWMVHFVYKYNLRSLSTAATRATHDVPLTDDQPSARDRDSRRLTSIEYEH